MVSLGIIFSLSNSNPNYNTNTYQVKADAVNHHTDTANSVDGIKSCHVIDSCPDMQIR